MNVLFTRGVAISAACVWTQLEDTMAKRSHGKKNGLKFPDWNTPKPPKQPPPPQPPGSGCGTGSETKKVMDFLDKIIGRS